MPLNLFWMPIKVSAHSFKRFTSRLLKLSFSLSIHLLLRRNVMLDFIRTLPVQLWGTRNKWTLQKNLAHGRMRTTNTASRLQVHRSQHSATTLLVSDGMKCPCNLYIDLYDLWINMFTCACTQDQHGVHMYSRCSRTLIQHLYWFADWLM